MNDPHARFARCPQRGRSQSLGAATRAAGEGPRAAGIDGQCESAPEADAQRADSVQWANEAEARRD